MLSVIQQQKLEKLFHLYDIDGNQYLEDKDFKAVVEGFSLRRQLAKNSPAIVALTERFADDFKMLKALADSDGDGKVTLNEWLANGEKQMASDIGHQHLVGSLTDLIFDIFDSNNNQQFTLTEYRDFCWAYHARGFDVEQNFKQLCPTGDNLSKAEFGQLIREFFADDATAKGNNLFGPLA